jgi:alkanesulfonate monooxygenase SsuD/methylene tetrahydromethanopterin reductase-like flavin-dependent oxidoreductase (luciferase family)
MLAFHMYCHEDTIEAARIARGPLNRYLKLLVDAARGWVDGAASDNYTGYGKMIEALDHETFESQVEKGSAWVGTPEEISEQIRSYHVEIGGFDDASLQVNFNDMPFEDAERSVKLFGEKVMPAFAKG